MAYWNPWVGCKKCSEGCLHCYIHKSKKIDATRITKTKEYYKPISKKSNGEYTIKNGIVYTCFKTDFLLEEADTYRDECLNMIKIRNDLTFLFLTKRIDRYENVIKNYIGDNVVIGCTVENQKNVDYRLNIFSKLNIKHKCIILQPLLENVDISNYLDNIELVVVGGESDYNARVLNYDWVLNIRKQCVEHNVNFEFRQCGTKFIMNNKTYYLKTSDLTKYAKKIDINFKEFKNL